MLYFTKHEADCTGCGACYSACPVHCITMQPDVEGFLYPVASDQCIHCGKCERVCPVSNKIDFHNDIPKVTVAAVSKDKQIWRRSASGGAFSEICRTWGDQDTLIAGAAWNGFRVRHMCVKGVDNIAPLCKSKYVASAIGDTFLQIKEALSVGGKVIFCGTPCQVAGLKAYLDKPYDNLLTIDLICHGVGSPAVFAECIKAMGSRLKKEISAYEFRAKRWTHYVDYMSKVTFAEDGTEAYLINDPYIQLFLSQRALRTSCAGACIYRNENRPGDITIADFKGLLEEFPHLTGTKRNYSAVVANTEKGLAVVDRLDKRMEVLKSDVSAVKKYNPLFYRQTYFPKDREQFLEEFRQSPSAAVAKWTQDLSVDRMSWKRVVFDALPQGLRKLIPYVLSMRRKNG